MMEGDEIWDEHEWEAHLRENDQRTDLYMKDFNDFVTDNPMPASEDKKVLRDWDRRLDEFMAARGWEFHGEDIFGDDEEEDDVNELFMLDDSFLDEEHDEEEDGALLGRDDFRDLPVYQRTYDTAIGVLQWANALPSEVKDSSLVHLCNNLLQMPTNVAKGHAYGFQRQMLGGYIACVKRALGAANNALNHIRELRDAPFMGGKQYREMYERIYECRNDLAVYVTDLRRRFELGID
jgi:hypothetical protein